MTATQLDRGTIRRHLDSFAADWRAIIDDWRDTDAKHTEKSHAQQFWSDLLRCFGVIPERIKLFERDATRATSGRTGYIDLFWSGVVIGEAKSLGRDLDAATEQARDYLAGGSIAQHEWPRYSIVSDFENLRVTKLGDDGWTVSFTIDEITGHVDQLIFLAGQETVTKAEEEEASIHASKLMATMYTAMLGDEDADEAVGDDAPTDPEEEDWQVQKTSVFLTRVLFLLYGDDAGLWEEDLFYRFVVYDTTPDNLGAQLAQLFQVLNTPENRRRHVPDSMAKFPYVNGGLFADSWPSEFFTAQMHEALLAACRFHWTRISPAVFGSMFQLVKSKEARRADGEHYTTETNILKVIEPLFLDELRDKARRLINNKSTKASDLRKFRDSLAEMIFLDPACGCGNFLVVAYRELRQIETDIIVALRAKEGQQTASMDVSLDQRMNIGQFHGFELNWWPAKIAETAMFLVDHQANRALAAAVGDAPDRLPITITAHIRHGNALQLGWEYEIPRTNGATYVFGNPPFLGDHTRTKDQLTDMQAAWGGDKTLSRLDYVTAWHAKTLTLLADRTGSFAFVTTNSITQGDQPARLFQPIFDAGWRIRFAHRTFPWNSDAPGKAAVHCVIIGFDRESTPRPRLWDYPDSTGEPVTVPVEEGINAYLVDGPNVLVDKRSKPLSPLLPKVVKGSMATDDGNFIVEPAEYAAVITDPVAAKYLRPYKGARELIRGGDRWCLWLVELDPSDLSRSPELRRRIDAVRKFRAESKAASTREYAYNHLFRQFGLVTDERFVALPEVSSENRRYLPVDYLPPEVIISNKVYGAPDDGGLLFGLAASSMFITWMKAVGGRMKSDLSLSSTITWNNFPVPELDEKTRVSIIKAGQGVLDARALHPDRSLADAYNPLAMDPVLVKAHDKLDRAVDKAFGADRKLTTERQRLEILFARYAEMTAEKS
ncbi:DNA methyltransferase [Corynebacterium variabile]